MGHIGQAILRVKVPNSSHVTCIQQGRVLEEGSMRLKHWVGVGLLLFKTSPNALTFRRTMPALGVNEK